MPVCNDQLGNKITLHAAPQKIISIVPSQSEFLWDLGVKPIGITKFCIHPEEMFRSCERVGGTKTLDIKKIRELNPDLIIGNREENEMEQIFELQKEFPVWMSDIITLEDAIDMMTELIRITEREITGKNLLDKVNRSITSVRNKFEPRSVLYFMWNDPYMVAAKNTFINSILEHSGLINAAVHFQRYPVLDNEGLRTLNPELCFLSSEPFPFNKKHVTELQQILPDSKIILVDGEMFSWYGSRLAKLSDYLSTLNP